MSQHNKPTFEIIFIYLIICASGFLSFQFLPIAPPILNFFVADLVMTIVAYAFSVYKKNSSVYDAYWSVIPFLLLLFWFLQTGSSWQSAQYITAGTISFWSWRLTHNWFRSWNGWLQEDWRYVNFRKQFPAAFEWVNFFGIHLYPTAIVFLSMTGLFFLFDGTAKNLNTLILAGNCIALTGTFLEFFADNILYGDRNNPNRIKGVSIRKGLWKYLRNPNYLGEMLFWVGMASIGFGANAPWWCGLGAVGMVLMFLFASIPMKEKRLLQTRSDFKKYKAEVPSLIPFTK